MVKPAISILFGMALLLPKTSLAQEDQPRYRFDARVDLVSVAVAVTDKQGNFIKDLKPEDFTVYEDGARQKIVHFGSGLKESWLDLDPEMKEELSGEQVIALILDASGSMEEEMPLVRKAALKFLNDIPKTQHLFLLDFDENIRLSHYSSDDQRVIADRIFEVEAEGWTALYDAVATILNRSYGYEGKKTLVVFSDGIDSRSALSMNECLDMVKASDVTIHCIHFSHRNSSQSFTESRFLRHIADMTGGSYAFASSLEKLDEFYDRILEELFSQYTLGYVSTNSRRDGKYRKIKVVVHRDDVNVRHRRGYQGPTAELEPGKSP